MQRKFNIPTYKEAPFIRPLFALMLGIVVHWYIVLPLFVLKVGVIAFVMLYICIFLLQKTKPIFSIIIKSSLLQMIFFLIGVLLVHIKNIQHHPSYFAKKIASPNHQTIIVINEPLSEKTKTNKAVGSIIGVVNNDTQVIATTGKCIVYFKKDSLPNTLEYGNTIVIHKLLSPIQNNGNPGSFNYVQQSLFNGITHQVFLNAKDYAILPEKHTTVLQSFLFGLREKVLRIIDKNIVPLKEKGVAEALLIGYRDDLDKDLSQAYSNTGTIHVIAISGLHLGFIYLILVAIFKPFEKKKWVKSILKPIVIILVLWIFSLLAGGAASILRSAIMFTCIVVGDSLARKTSIYNTLAISAFIILCINPFSLWDVGFQLSYAAVLSIVIFMQPIYKLWYIKNKVVDWLWKLNAVTLSAQILTIPIVIYHFHQFPNLFLLTNIVAVPLSTIILGVELLLLVFSWWPAAAAFIGNIVYWLIRILNTFIEWCNSFSFAITDYLQMNILECYVLYVIIGCFGYWLLKKYKPALYYGLGFVVIALSLSLWNKYKILKQEKLIVYNIPNHQAIDFVRGSQYTFIGDSLLQEEGFNKNFHIKPARIAIGTKNNTASLVLNKAPFYCFGKRNFLLIDGEYQYHKLQGIGDINTVVLSKNPKLYIDSLVQYVNVQQVVADASNPSWKIRLWQKDCERLKIPFHNTQESGAFVQRFTP